MTVDKLGIKLYDKVANVVAEMIANSYDGDAELVNVKIPLNAWLANKTGGKVRDRGLVISVEDDGHGMQRDRMNQNYLVVGSNPREDKFRGPRSLEKKRPIMGRKGIGKLAPFGICRLIEVWSAGGPRTSKGYRVAHLFLNYDEIYFETDSPYHPKTGPDDGKFVNRRGTIITMRNFLYRRTPDPATFHRQLARIFGIQLPDFKVRVKDTTTGKSFTVGRLKLDIDESTKIIVDRRPVRLSDGTELKVKGYVAYANIPYKNEEVAGVRVYARGKLIATTRDFGLRAGFTGEFTIRSYLTGEIRADWLDVDTDEDLIHTGRQDILWDSEKGTAFREWGQGLLRELGKTSFAPMRERTSKIFLEKSKLEERAKKMYGDSPVSATVLKLGKAFGVIASRESLQDQQYVDKLAEIVLSVAPHSTLVDTLTKISQAPLNEPMDVIVQIFNDAKLAEEASLGQVARERVTSIRKLEQMIEANPPVDERTLQALLESAPWLINSKWTVLQANRPFEQLRDAFAVWYFKEKGERIVTTTINSLKRPDFVMLPISGKLEIVEIKKSGHALEDQEFDRLNTYRDSLSRFLEENKEYKAEFGGVHVTLICDSLNLSRAYELGYERLETAGDLKRETWLEVLRATSREHQDFLDRAASTMRR